MIHNTLTGQFVYLDNAATTPCVREVVEAMLPFFSQTFANASSIDHLPGIAARRAVETARESISQLLNAQPEDVIFTSGSTEANNLAINMADNVLTTPVEHPSILEAFNARRSHDDKLIPVDSDGLVNDQQLLTMLKSQPHPTTVSIIATNNETGVEQYLEPLAAACNAAGALLHLDITQAITSRSVDLRRLGAAGASISAHKIHGPKGVGALVADRRLRRRLQPLSRGGGHERGIRSGTLNVPGIVGFGAAARLLIGQQRSRRGKLETLRSAFLDALRSVSGISFSPTTSCASVSPHILSMRFERVNGRALLSGVRNHMAFSLGSACATNKSEPSHVMTALGLSRGAASEVVRFSFDPGQPVEDVQRAALLVGETALKLRQLSRSA